MLPRSGVVAACLLVYLELEDNAIDALDHVSTAVRENVGTALSKVNCIEFLFSIESTVLGK
jgi:hypothetical protein